MFGGGVEFAQCWYVVSEIRKLVQSWGPEVSFRDGSLKNSGRIAEPRDAFVRVVDGQDSAIEEICDVGYRERA